MQLITSATMLIGETIGLHAAKSYDGGVSVEQARRELGLPGERSASCSRTFARCTGRCRAAGCSASGPCPPRSSGRMWSAS